MLRRLQQEIEALGFSVQVESRGFTERPPAELSANGAVAAIEVVTTIPGFIALYVLEPKTARIIRQELPIEAPNDPTATELVATRAVELLRAARLDVGTRPTPPPVVPAPTMVPQPTVAMEPSEHSAPAAQLRFGAGPGFSYVPHWRMSSNFGVAVTYVSRWRWGWVGSVQGALTPARISIPDVGVIEAFPTNLRAGLALQAFDGKVFGLRVAGGVEWSQLKFSGDVSAPYVGSSVFLSTLGPWLSVGVGLRLSSQFQLLTQCSSSWATPRTAVRFAGHELRDWGRPALSGGIHLEWQAL